VERAGCFRGEKHPARAVKGNKEVIRWMEYLEENHQTLVTTMKAAR
jgi:hypothetical protein